MTTTVPLLATPGFVLLPGCTATLFLGPDILQRQVALSEGWSRLICVIEAGHYQRERNLVGCLAQVRAVQKLATGWTVQLAGLRRLRIEAELQTDQGVLIGGQELASQPWPDGQRPPVIEGLCELVQQFWGRIEVGLWLDMAAFHLPLHADTKQFLLCQPDPRLRAELLRNHQSQLEAAPIYSLN